MAFGLGGLDLVLHPGDGGDGGVGGVGGVASMV